jgi:hypothetical protein
MLVRFWLLPVVGHTLFLLFWLSWVVTMKLTAATTTYSSADACVMCVCVLAYA